MPYFERLDPNSRRNLDRERLHEEAVEQILSELNHFESERMQLDAASILRDVLERWRRRMGLERWFTEVPYMSHRHRAHLEGRSVLAGPQSLTPTPWDEPEPLEVRDA